MTFLAQGARAQVLFEGYSKLLLQKQFIGFVIQRYEYKPTQKQFLSTYVIKYNELGGSGTESLSAIANEALEPISYSYNSMSSGVVKTIDGINEKGKLKLTITENGRRQKKEKVLPKGSFFSTFLAYVILKNPQGLKPSTKYEYQGIAEEDGEVYKGTAIVQTQETYKSIPVYKIVNDFKDSKFITYSTEKGEMLASECPEKDLMVELMPEPAQAMGSMSISADNLKLLFGTIPEGKVNALVAGPVASAAISPAASPAPAPTAVPSKIKHLGIQPPINAPAFPKKGTTHRGVQTKPK